MSENTPKTSAIVMLYSDDTEGPVTNCRIKTTGLMVTEGGRDASGRVSPDIAEAIANLALAIRLKNEGADQAHLRDAIRKAGVTPNTGKLDASKITIKDEPQKALALFTIQSRRGVVEFTESGIRVTEGDHDGTLMQHAMAALPLILERERDRQMYGPHKVISLQDAVTAIREAIEDGDDATVDAAGDAIAELVRFIGRADDDEVQHRDFYSGDQWPAGAGGTVRNLAMEAWRKASDEAIRKASDEAMRLDDTELAEAIAHERKRAQAEAEERGTAETITDAQSAIKAGPSCSAQDAVSGVAEGLAAAGRLTFRGEPVTEHHHFTTKEHRSRDAVTGRVTETTTTTHSWTPRR